MEERKKIKLITPVGQLCFPSLVEPATFGKYASGQFEATLVLEKNEEAKKLKAALQEFAGEGVELPFKDGNKKDLEKYPNFKNKIYIKAKTRFPVKLVDRQNNCTEQEFYPGCFVRLQVSPYVYETTEKIREGEEVKTIEVKGVGLSLQAVKFIKDGERLGGDGLSFPDEPEESFDEDNIPF